MKTTCIVKNKYAIENACALSKKSIGDEISNESFLVAQLHEMFDRATRGEGCLANLEIAMLNLSRFPENEAFSDATPAAKESIGHLMKATEQLKFVTIL